MAESLSKLKLSVWRDYVPDKSLILRRGTENDQALIGVDSDLQQEVYCWQMREDPFAGVSEEALRTRLQELLINSFDASRAPPERRFTLLRAFLDEVTAAIEANSSEWTVSQDPPTDDEEAPYRLNPLLALKLHLEWLSESFAGQPGVSVSIR